MPTLIALPDNQQFESLPGETLLAASLRHGIPHVHTCGGHARCPICRVLILEGLAQVSPRNAQEQALAIRANLSPTVCLACQTSVTEGTVRFRRSVIDGLDVQLVQQDLVRLTEQLGEEKQLAVLFSDIEDYTVFAETLPPYDVIHVLNRYFYLIGQAVGAPRGRIIDYIGDGMMVVFGLNAETSAAADAVAAVLAMQRAVERLNS